MTQPGQPGEKALGTWLRITAAALFCALVALIAGTVLFVRQAQRTMDLTSRQVTLNVQLRALQTLQVTLGDAETGQRGYLLTGMQEYLRPYEAALLRLPPLVAEVDRIADGYPALASQVSELHDLIGRKLNELAETIRLQDANRRDEALRRVLAGDGQRSMDQARLKIGVLLDNIRADRDGMNDQIRAASVASRRVAVGTVSALAACILLAAVQITALSAARGRYESALVESENRHRAIVEEQQELVSLADELGKLVYLNPAYARHFRRPVSEILGSDLFDLVEPEDREIVRLHLGEVLRTGSTMHGENRMVTIDGREKWVAWTNSVQKGPRGERFLHSVGRDITERKQAELNLKATERALRDLTEIFDNTTDFVVQTDGRGKLQYMNPAARRGVGFTPDQDVTAHSFSEFVTADTKAFFFGEIAPAVQREGIRIGESTVLLTGGRVVPVNHMVIAHDDASGRVARYSGVMRDISDAVASRKEIQRQTATLHAVIEAIPAIVAVFDEQFRYRLVNRAFERWRGMERERVLGRGFAELFGGEEFERNWPWAERALKGEAVQYEAEYPTAPRATHLSISYVPLRLDDGAIDGLVAVAQDITVHRQEEIRLLGLTERDALTGMLNRAGFVKHLAHAIEAGHGANLALLYIDLDHFKSVNDKHGHPVGDEVLRLFAQRIRKIVRPTDAVARLGGDEFAVVLSAVRELADANAVADKLIDSTEEAIRTGNCDLIVRASVGVAFDASGDRGWEGLVERADGLVYRAKREGRGRRSS